jgi:hypothetical protein
VRKLGKQKVANIFTHLRKIAQHPLLVRRLYDDAKVAKMAALAHSRWMLPYSPASQRYHKALHYTHLPHATRMLWRLGTDYWAVLARQCEVGGRFLA